MIHLMSIMIWSTACPQKAVEEYSNQKPELGQLLSSSNMLIKKKTSKSLEGMEENRSPPCAGSVQYPAAGNTLK